MASEKKIKVLVVDDSLIFREVIARGLASDPNIEVVAKAVDPFDARDKIIEYRPDVMTCDIQMPKMDGIEFIKRLLPQYALPVVVISTLSGAVFDAMRAGAVDFVVKPNVQSPKDIESFILDLIRKVKIAKKAKVTIPVSSHTLGDVRYLGGNNDWVIAIGASTGGIEAICDILKRMPSNSPGMVIVQHIPPLFSKMFAERLDKQMGLEFKEAQTGDVVEPGRVLLAPGDMHMRLKKHPRGFAVECFEGERVNGHRPSVDVLFESVAKEAGERAVGVILTGMGYDGARGLLSMRRRGARTIGQDEKTSIVYGMPKVSFELGAVEKQVGLEKVADTIFSLLTAKAQKV